VATGGPPIQIAAKSAAAATRIPAESPHDDAEKVAQQRSPTGRREALALHVASGRKLAFQM
jgi:hypothetical protein